MTDGERIKESSSATACDLLAPDVCRITLKGEWRGPSYSGRENESMGVTQKEHRDNW